MATVRTSEVERLRRLSLLASRAFVESGLHGIDAEVSIALDVSLAMAPMYLSGSIQQLVESLLALGMRFDDDGIIPAWSFGETARPLGELTRDDYIGWVERRIACGPNDLDGVSNYAPIIEAICKKHFPREWALPPTEIKIGDSLKRTMRSFPSLIDKRPLPYFVILVTAGDCADPTETIRVLQRASHLPVFFQFAGISPPGIPSHGFAFLERIDRLSARHADNCGFFAPRDYTEPDELFAGLLNEFPSYLDLPQVQEMLVTPGPESDDEIASGEGETPLEKAMRREQRERQRRREARAAEQAEAIARSLPSVGAQAHASGDPEQAPPPPVLEEGVAASREGAPRRVNPMTRPYERERAGPMPAPVMAVAPRAAPPPPRAPSPGQGDGQVATPRHLPRPSPAPARTYPGSAAAAMVARNLATSTTQPPPVSPPLPPSDEEDDPAVRLARIRARRAARRARGEHDPG